MSNYPDNFTRTSQDARLLRGDDLDDAIELDGDYDALAAIDEARTAYRKAVIAQLHYLSSAGREIVGEYLEDEDTKFHEAGVAGRLQDAIDAEEF